MTRLKLTKAQLRQMKIIGNGIAVTTWGDKAMGRLPEGITLQRLWLLQAKNALSVERRTGRTLFAPTPAGRAALEEAEAGAAKDERSDA